MNPNILIWLELIAPVALFVLCVTLALLSRRFGIATRAPAYYTGFFIAAALVLVTITAQIANLVLNLADLHTTQTDPLWLILYQGLPAIAVTLSLMVAWRYWSWLLAERD